MRLAGLLVCAVLLALVAEAHAQEGRPPERDGGFLIERDDVRIAPHASVKLRSVQVDNRFGDVTVVGHDEPDVVLHVVKRGPDGDTLDRLKVNLVTDPDGRIVIGTALLAGEEARPLPAKSIRIDITIEMPRGAHVALKAWNGKLGVTGLRAGASLSAHAADMTITDVTGNVTTDNTRGHQKLTSVKGTVKADNTYGEVELESISGDSLAASVHDGQVVATRIRSRHVKLRTTFGDIHFTGELLAGGRVDLATYKGDVKVSLVPSGKPLALAVDAYARDGAVDSRLDMAAAPVAEKGRLQGTFGKGKKKPAALSVSSMLGDVTIGLVNE